MLGLRARRLPTAPTAAAPARASVRFAAASLWAIAALAAGGLLSPILIASFLGDGTAHASSGSRESDKLQRELERQRKEAEKAAREAERELERQRKEIEKAAREAEREMERQRKEVEKAARDAEKAARDAEKAVRESDKAARDAAKAAKAAAKEAEAAAQPPRSESTAPSEGEKRGETAQKSADDTPAPGRKSERKSESEEGSASQGPGKAVRAKEAELPPPATVGELLGRIFGFAAPAEDPEADGKTANIKPDGSGRTNFARKDDAGKGPADKGLAGQAATGKDPPKKDAKADPKAPAPPAKAPAKVALPGPAVQPLRLPRAAWKAEDLKLVKVPPREIVALDLDAKALSAAQRHGFKVTSRASAFGTTTTTLLPPPGLAIAEARRTLEREAPQAMLAFNHVYSIYRTATADSDADTTLEAKLGARMLEHPVAPPGAPPRPMCQGERCYGWTLVDWSAQAQRCAAGVKVGVIDTAVDHAHPAFRHLKPETGVFVPTGASKAPVGHGTGIAAVLFGDRRSETPGLIPDARAVFAEAFYGEADGSVTSSTARLVEALAWLEAAGVRVVNMSFTGPRDELLEAAIRAMAARGIIFVAAAGNEGPNASPSYPAAYPEVIAVTAIGTERTSYARANRGSYIDVAAPGVRIWTAKAGGGAGYESGTSFAAPYVAALVATLAGQRPGDGGAATKSAVLQRLRYEDLGAPGPDRIYGRGLVLAPEACRAPKAPPATVASGRGGWSVTTIKAGAAR